MVTRSESVKRFLHHSTHGDLSSLYHIGMECQVNVSQDGGERIEGDFRGNKWHAWTDGTTTWKSFRIPYNAKSDPSYDDPEIKFDLVEHAEGIGMTGWDWKAKRSRWVAYDFDAIVGHSDRHSAKITDAEMEEVKNAAKNIPWVTIRKSTSGSGLHLYVFIDSDIEVVNHTEHAALARAILGKMSAITGFNFDSKVDICGGNMWVWHRKMKGTDGLSLIKQGVTLTEIPSNWKDHVKVINRKRRKVAPQVIDAMGKLDVFEELAGQHPRVPLDDKHKELLKWLQDNGKQWEWDQDNHMLITHTLSLEEAQSSLNLRGYFKTSSTGSSEINCFCFPMRKGAWSVRRYTPGVSEHPCWSQDGSGWTRAYINREPDLATICLAFGAVEDPSGGFVFREAEMAQQAALHLGVDIKIGSALRSREAKLKEHKDGRLVVEIERKNEDRGDDATGFLGDKTKWKRIYNSKPSDAVEPECGGYDDFVRHVVSQSHEDAGWVLNVDGNWHLEPIANVRIAMGSMGLPTKEINGILGASVLKAWKLVNKPFQDEYPGDREWNRYGAKLTYTPSENDDLEYSTWMQILNHSGKQLDSAVKKHPWCKVNGILTGGDYLKCWIASLIQNPYEPLPYLFFYSPENNTGKSIVHEALRLLFTRGITRADVCLTNTQGFNGELEGAVVCVVEEINLSDSKLAYNRIKDWVTSPELMIHCKGATPYHTLNTTHWIQCSNYHDACPIFVGDSRITMINVRPLEPWQMIPKRKLVAKLKEEASDFLAEMLRLEVPVSDDRLALPIIDTDDRRVAQDINLSPLEMFIRDHTNFVPGSTIPFSEFYDRYADTMLKGDELSYWTKIRVGKSLPPQYPKGKLTGNPNIHIGNMSWCGLRQPEPSTRLILRDDYLKEADDDQTTT